MINNSNNKSVSPRGTIFSSLITGLILGTLQITYVLAFTALIFPPELSEFFTQGMAILLFGAVISFTLLALFSSYVGTIGSAQDIPASISAVMAVSIVAAMGNEAPMYAIFSTVIMAMALASFLSATVLILLGLTGMGKIVRYMPYPVIGGLLISTGWILSQAGLTMMPDQWLIGAGFAVLLLLTRRFFSSPWVLPVLLVVAIIAINTYLSVMGISIDMARKQGLLLDVEFNKIPFLQPPASIFSAADWRVVFNQFPTIISLCFITCLVVLIQISTIEVLVKQEMESRRELYVTGFTNLVVSFCCGLISYHHISSTTLAYNMGARTRAVGVIAAMLCMLVFLTNSKWMVYLPLPVLAGLILYLGLSFIDEWLIQAYRKVPRTEYTIMLGIFACAIFVNFPAAITLGIICGILLFLFQHNKVGILDAMITAGDCKSSVMRSTKQAEFLASHPHSITAFKLKGVLYFGTANELYDISSRYVRHTKSEQHRYIIFDFQHVSAIDSTALMSVFRTHQYLSKQNIDLVISAMRADQINQIKTFYACNDLIDSLCWSASLDHAIEYSEDRLLISAGLIDTEHSDCLDTIFKKQGWDKSSVNCLKNYLQRQVLHDHQLLIRSGENNDDIYIITAGKLEIVSRKTETTPLRLRVIMPGMIVGEMSLYTGLPRSADVIASGSATVYKLSSKQFSALQDQHPGIAIKLHKYFAKIMAERLIDEPRLQLIRSS